MNWNTFNRNSLSNQLGVYGQPQQLGAPFIDLGSPVTDGDMAGAQSIINNYQQGGLSSLLGSYGNGSNGLLGLGRLGLGAIGTVGGLINSRNMLGLARDQFKHARDVTNTNLTNQIQSYNTALADRARNRAVMEGRDPESANKYIEENKLRR